MHSVNDPRVVAEVTAEFDRYELALMANDVTLLNAFFWQDAHTVRFGTGEQLYGAAEIAAFRATRNPAGLARRLRNVTVTTFGESFATTTTEFIRHTEPQHLGRQSQTWVRFAEGWRIVSAHVSLIAAVTS